MAAQKLCKWDYKPITLGSRTAFCSDECRKNGERAARHRAQKRYIARRRALKGLPKQDADELLLLDPEVFNESEFVGSGRTEPAYDEIAFNARKHDLNKRSTVIDRTRVVKPTAEPIAVPSLNVVKIAPPRSKKVTRFLDEEDLNRTEKKGVL